MCRAFLPLVLVAFLTAGTASGAGPVRLGVFNVDVSPPLGSPLAYDECVGVAMPLSAKGVVLLGAESPIVLASVDWIGIANEAHAAWRAAIAVAAGTTADRVSLHTIHQHDAPFYDSSAEKILAAHGAPGLLYDVPFARQCVERLVDAVREAAEQAEPVTHLGIGQATVEKVASNRRILGVDGKVRVTRYTATKDPAVRMEPEGTIDPRLKSISFWRDDQPLAVLTYYATHPQSYYRRGIANPDFPGMARFLRQVALNGIPHVHFNGAGGNIGAGKYNDGSSVHRQQLAVRLAKGMAEAWATTERHALSSETIRWHTDTIQLPPAPHLDAATLLNAVASEAATPLDRKTAATDLAWLRRCQQGDGLLVSCLQLGPAKIVHLPGEAVVEYQLYAQQLQPETFIAVAAYGDYGTGYICLTRHYAEGGYEASPRASRVAPQSEPILKAAIRHVLQSE